MGLCDSTRNININIFNYYYICQISTPRITGIGAFLKITVYSKPFYCIITNIELNKKELLELNENIEVNYNCLQNKFIINLKENERFLRYYKDFNITIIQILIDIDSISENCFISPKSTYENLVEEKIYISQISKGNKYSSFFKGKIKKINGNIFTYFTNVKNGFLGNFIF